jgi:hypothetical protein
VVLDDGRVLAESNAILWYFAEGTRFLPEDRAARAEALQWMFFEQYSHEPNIATVRFWMHIGRDKERLEQTAEKRKLGEAARAEAIKQALGKNGIDAAMVRTEGRGRPLARDRKPDDVAELINRRARIVVYGPSR